MAILEELLVAIGVDDRDLSRAAARADRQFGRINRSAESMQKVGKKMTMGLTVPLIAVGATAIKTAAEFDKSLSGVEAVTGATAKELQGLEEAARSAAKGTSFTATQASDALMELGKTGFSATEAIDGLPPVLQLATAGQLEMARAADISSTIMNTMGLEAKDLNKVTDALAKGATSSATNVNQMGFAFARSAAASKAAGLSVNEATEAVALMAEAGFRGTAAGTGLNKILGALNTEGSKGADLFKKYGVELRRSDGSLRRLSDISLDAKKAGVEYNDVIEAFGLNHGPKFAAMLGLTDKKLKSVQAAMEDTEGAGAEMAATMEDNLQGAFKRLQSAWEELMLTLTRDTGISDFLKEFVDGLAKAIVRVADFAREHPKITAVGLAFLGVVATVGPLLVALGFVIGQLRNLTIIAGVAQLVMQRLSFAFLTNPIFLVVAGLVALAGALVIAYKNSETFRKIVDKAFSRIKAAFNEVVEIARRVKEAFGKGGLSAAVDEAGAAFQELGPKILEKLKGVFTSIVDFIASNGPQIIETLLELRAAVFEGAIQLFTAIVEALPVIIPQVVEAITTMIIQLVETLVALLPVLLEGAVTLLTGLVQAVTVVLPLVLEGIVMIIQAVLTALVEALPLILAAGVALLMALLTGLVETLPILIEFVLELIPLLVETVVTLLPLLIEAGIKLLMALLNGLIETLPVLIAFVLKVVPMLVKALLKLDAMVLEAGIKLIAKLLLGMAEKIPDVLDWMSQNAPKIAQKILDKAPQFLKAGERVLGQLLAGLKRKAPDALAWARGRLGPALLRAFLSIQAAAARAGRAIISGLIRGIKEKQRAAVNAARGVVKSALQGAKNLLGIRSPSRVFMEIGRDSGAGLAIGLRDAERDVVRAAEEIARSAAEAMSPKRSGMDRAVDELRELVESGRFKKQGSLLFEDVAFQGMSKNFQKFHGEIADGFWNAVFEIEKAVKRGKKVTEAFTFEGMSKDVEKFGGLIGKLFRSSATARGASTAVKDFVPQDIFTMTGFADGGIATRPTMGMIGEAGEDEAVAPLSKLDEMIRDSVRDALRSKASSHTQVSTRSIRERVGPQRVEIVLSGPEEMKRLIRKIDRTDGLGLRSKQGAARA